MSDDSNEDEAEFDDEYDEYDEYDDEYDDGRPRWMIPVAVGVAIAVALIGVLAISQLRSDSDDANVADPSNSSTTTTTTATTRPSTATTVVDSSIPPRTPTVAASEDAPVDSTDTTNPQSSPETTTTTAAAPATAAVSPLGYPTSPDGSPLPLVVIFDVDTITISGQVPSQEAKDRLGFLALANSQFPEAVVVDNMVINPAVPISVGVRVIELNSARFPEGKATILPDHALELDRVVAIMNALPNISVLVVGHADQRGDDLKNFAISDERARAVVNYLLYLGISQTRLASRAAGENDLLTLGDDDASLALNRRTEFVFYGLLIP